MFELYVLIVAMIYFITISLSARMKKDMIINITARFASARNL